jgi:predicted porin
LKTTFMLCVIAAVALMAGVTMAQDIAYQVYGAAHVSTDLQNNGDKSKVFVSSNVSRVGIKGSLDTDSDLFSVIFQYESQVDFNGNNNEKAAWCNRNSFAGLKGSWGKLIWGRHDTPFKILGRQVEFFAERVGDARNATQYYGYGWDNRPQNMIMYTTPVLGEMITIAGQYMAYQGLAQGELFSASATYDKNGLLAGVAVEGHGKGLEPYYTSYGRLTSVDRETAPTPESSAGLRAAVRYKGEDFTVGGLWQSLINVGGKDGVSGMAYGIGAEYVIASAWNLKGQIYMLDPNTDAEKDGATMMTVGVDYVLSKQVRLYAAYATMANQDNSNSFIPYAAGHGQSFGLANTVHPVPTDPPAADPPDLGLSPSSVSVGLTVAW